MIKTIGIKTISLLCILLSFAVLISCRSTKTAADSKDLSYIYNPTKNPINPRYNVVNKSDESSDFSVKFFANDLFFSEANPQGIPIASVMVSVKLFNINNGRVLADTAALDLKIVKEKGKTEYIYTMPLTVEKGNDYVAEVKILDKLRLSIVHSFVPFNTKSYFNKYNFIAQGHFERNQLFNPTMRVNEYVNLVYVRGHIDSLFISYYKPFGEIPDPPSLLVPEKTIDYGPDRTVAVPYSDTLPMMFPRPGIYLCSTARDGKEGYTFLNFGATYPSMTSPETMIEPLAYLATADEMSAMRSAIKPKAALDDFWIKCGGNVEKARELIRIYYTRALYSNFYFASYMEGWRSERGMVYIIYGPPDKVYKTPDGESWGYKKPPVHSKWGSRYAVKEEYIFFNFKKKENVFSDNDYYLSRSETLVTYWDKAIASWRKGIVFRVDNPQGI